MVSKSRGIEHKRTGMSGVWKTSRFQLYTTMRLRIRSKNGTSHLETSSSCTLRELRDLISEKTGIPSNSLAVVAGFPPKQLDLYGAPDENAADTVVNDNEVLTVSESSTPFVSASGASQAPSISGAGASACTTQAHSTGSIGRNRVPDDNSCLFRSLSWLIFSEDSSQVEGLRDIVGQQILSDPVLYNAAILGRQPGEYVSWIKLKNSWGGAIELKALSDFSGVAFWVMDVTQRRIQRFGDQEPGTETRPVAFLLYTGIHYDPLYWMEGSQKVTICRDRKDLEKWETSAERLMNEAHDRHDYTDTSVMQLVCMDCGTRLSGERAASQHAESTRHTHFDEMLPL